MARSCSGKTVTQIFKDSKQLADQKLLDQIVKLSAQSGLETSGQVRADPVKATSMPLRPYLPEPNSRPLTAKSLVLCGPTSYLPFESLS